MTSTALSVNVVTHLPPSLKDLADFAPVEGRWECDDSSLQHIVPQIIAHHLSGAACQTFGDDIHADEIRVELFGSDGRSLDGSDGITAGNYVACRTR